MRSNNEEMKKFRDDINKMAPNIENQMYKIMESMNYKESSNFSFSIDFWRRFVKYVNEWDKPADNEKE